MKKFIRNALLALLTVQALPALATTYNFSYTFDKYSVVTGSFDGNANGNLITGLSDITASYNGVAFAKGANLNATGAFFSQAYASFDGLQNNFSFYGGSFFSASSFSYMNTLFGYSAVTLSTPRAFDLDISRSAAKNWTIAAVSAVPEPATYGMLLGGLGLVGFAARRRRNAA